MCTIRCSLSPFACAIFGTSLAFCLQQAAVGDDVLAPLDVRQVKVGGEIGRRIDVTVNNNLLVLDVEKDFLDPFRKKVNNYIGLGKLIDATVRFAAYTGDDKVLALKKHLVDEIIKTQEADGYIGTMPPDLRMWNLWDIHEMGYLIYGLTTDYRLFGEKRSLEAAQKMADYILQRWSTMPANWSKQTTVATNVAVTGLERAMLTLYGETKDRRYLDFCVKERALPEWDLGIVLGRRDQIEGHVYGYVARCLAQLALSRIQPDERLWKPTNRAIHFMTAEDGMCLTGGVGQSEIWTDDQDVRCALGETCATAYQLRLYDNLLRMKDDPYYGDLMERTIHNALFAAQSPDGRRLRYFAPLEGKREYWSTDTYCCPCNYRRIVAELPTMVYYRSSSGPTVNLYSPSEATFDLADGTSLKIRQETDYPTSGHVVVQLDPSKPAKFPLRLRIPRWCANATASVNGELRQGPIAAGNYLTIDRLWNAGDKVTLDFPMSLRVVAGRKRQSGRAAVMRGPLVLCLNPAQNAALAGMDGADLSYMMIDPNTLQEAPSSSVVHPGGVACTVKAEKEWGAVGVPGSLSLTLTEFPDPDGKAVYFRLPDPAVAKPDELLQAK